jgi:hypothetical protein
VSALHGSRGLRGVVVTTEQVMGALGRLALVDAACEQARVEEAVMAYAHLERSDGWADCQRAQIAGVWGYPVEPYVVDILLDTSLLIRL